MELTYIIVLIILLIFVFLYVKQIYIENDTIKNKKGINGQEVCHAILEKHSIKEVYVVELPVTFYLEYDYSRKVIRLSKDLFQNDSLSSLVFSSFVSALAVLDKKGDKKLLLWFNILPLFRLLILIFFLLFLGGILLNEFNFIFLSFGLLVILFFFSIVSVFILKNVCDLAKRELLKLSKEEETKIKKMFQIILLYYFCEVIHYPYYLIQKIMKR